MTWKTTRRVVAITAAAVTIATTVNVPLLAADPTVFTGKVFSPDRGSPRPGVVVRLVESGSDTTFDSAPTDADKSGNSHRAPGPTCRVKWNMIWEKSRPG